MRLTIVIEHFAPATGGAEGVAVGLARELIRRGHRLCIIAGDGEPLPGCELRIVTAAARAETARAVAADVVLDWGLSIPADIHRLGGGVNRAFRRCYRLSRPPSVRWLYALYDRVSPGQRRVDAREEALLRNPQARLLAVSEFVAAQVRQAVPEAASRLTVLRNGVDVKRFAPGNRECWRHEVRAELGLAATDVAFLFVAHNPRLKNFDLLARVFAALVDTVPQARLVLIGKHAPSQRHPWLVHAGATVRPERVYAAADAVLHPTLYDACANVVLEGLAAGLPVVSSDLNGSAEIITSEKDGFVLPVTGAAPALIARRWQDVVARLALGADVRLQVGAAARRLAEQHSFLAYVDRFEAYLLAARDW